jgi:hypothetical protein
MQNLKAKNRAKLNHNFDLLYFSLAAFFGALFLMLTLISTVKYDSNNPQNYQSYDLSASKLAASQVNFNWSPIAQKNTRLIIWKNDLEDSENKVILNISIDGMSSYVWTNGHLGDVYTAVIWNTQTVSNPVAVSTTWVYALPIETPTPAR